MLIRCYSSNAYGSSRRSARQHQRLCTGGTLPRFHGNSSLSSALFLAKSFIIFELGSRSTRLMSLISTIASYESTMKMQYRLSGERTRAYLMLAHATIAAASSSNSIGPDIFLLRILEIVSMHSLATFLSMRTAKTLLSWFLTTVSPLSRSTLTWLSELYMGRAPCVFCLPANPQSQRLDRFFHSRTWNCHRGSQTGERPLYISSIRL